MARASLSFFSRSSGVGEVDIFAANLDKEMLFWLEIGVFAVLEILILIAQPWRGKLRQRFQRLCGYSDQSSALDSTSYICLPYARAVRMPDPFQVSHINKTHRYLANNSLPLRLSIF